MKTLAELTSDLAQINNELANLETFHMSGEFRAMSPASRVRIIKLYRYLTNVRNIVARIISEYPEEP